MQSSYSPNTIEGYILLEDFITADKFELLKVIL
jgi:hypothetical protein